MTISVTNIGTANTGASGATVVLTLGAGITVPAGALIVLGVSDLSVSAPGGSATDSKSNSYSSAISANNNNTTASGFGAIFYAWNVTSISNSGADTITYTKAITASKCGISVFYATGIQNSSDPQDTAVRTSTFGGVGVTSLNSGTPSVAGELFVGLFSCVNIRTYTQDTTHSWATPFIEVAVNAELGGGQQVNSTANLIAFAPTYIGGNSNWATMVAGFKPTPATLPFNQADWPSRTQEPWYRSWEVSNTRYIGKDNLVIGRQIYDLTTYTGYIPQQSYRSWEQSNTRYIGKDNLNPGSQSYDRPVLLQENWRRSWEFSNVGYIGKDALNPGKQSYERPQLLPENWRRGWEYTNVRYIGKDSLNPGVQVYDLPKILPENWRRDWAQSLALNLIQIVQLPVGSQLYNIVNSSLQTQDYTFLLNLLESTLVPAQIIELHFRPFHTMGIGRGGNLGGLS